MKHAYLILAHDEYGLRRRLLAVWKRYAMSSLYNDEFSMGQPQIVIV